MIVLYINSLCIITIVSSRYIYSRYIYISTRYIYIYIYNSEVVGVNIHANIYIFVQVVELLMGFQDLLFLI